MTTLEIVLLIVYPITVGVAIFAFTQWMSYKRVTAMLVIEHEGDVKDIELLQKANEDFKAAHDNMQGTIDQLTREAALKERYIHEVIQPMIFNRRQKFMELDGISYELFGVVEIITKWPKCVNIIPVNLWDQISEELTKQQAYELLSQMQIYRRKFPMKFTPVPFGECFYRAPLWNLPNQ